MTSRWNIENDWLSQLKKNTLWKIIDEKKKNDPSLYIWKQAMIDYLLAEDNEKKLGTIIKWLFFEAFSSSIDELKDISKEIKDCQTVNELNNLEASITGESSISTTTTETTSNETMETTKVSDTSDHYEIDHFDINVSQKYRELYNKLKWPEKPDLAPFACAMKWYEELKWTLQNPEYLTVVDYTKPRSENRFYVINMDTNTVEHATRVWHWHNSWEWEWATSFSNINGSEQSNLWFLTTSAKRESNSNPNYHREWLRMYWTENSNNNAASRWIFMHRGQKNWSLFSQWCFVLPDDVSETILNKVIWGSLLFSYAKSSDYFANSNHFNTDSNWDVSIC